MAYQTGTTNSLNDLLNKFRAFAISSGWLVDYYDSSGSATLMIHDVEAKAFFSLKVSSGVRGEGTYPVDSFSPFTPVGRSIFLAGNTGYSSDWPWNLQPGSTRTDGVPADAWANTRIIAEMLAPTTGPYTRFYFFGAETYLHIVLEVAPAQFRHMRMGTLDKKGMEYMGGQYASAEGVGSPRIRAEGFDGITTIWSSGDLSIGLGTLDTIILGAKGNDFSGDTILVPNRAMLASPGNRSRFLGEFPDTAICSMQYAEPGDVLIYGAEEWQVFPILYKGTTGIQGQPVNPVTNGSGMQGRAFRIRR